MAKQYKLTGYNTKINNALLDTLKANYEVSFPTIVTLPEGFSNETVINVPSIFGFDYEMSVGCFKFEPIR